MVTISALMLIACAATFFFRGYQIRYRCRYDLIPGSRSRVLRDQAAWCRLFGALTLLLGAALLLTALATLAFPAMSREIAVVFCGVLLLAWGPATTSLARYERG